MAIIRCKMCGADLNITQGMEICECESCGTKQTLPKFDDDRRVTMYERANHFRRNSEFDKAMNMYEQILNEDRTDAEAYWSVVLCRYGIEYVEDVSTHKRIPTVNRAQHTSIFADEDYKEAINYATVSQKMIFEEEAKNIDEIQKGILEISRKEKPFDVFICYKETDANGNRTKDSVLANDIYHQLTSEGLKVFFAAITLEDKLGQAYEPYIFAALNSAKVMIVLGTKPEYFSAPWVKNEWSRYLTIIKNDPKKVIIPAYKDMDAYDLPEEFSFLQAQDMSKIGFMSDLIRGIKKIVNVDKVPATATVAQPINSVATVNLGGGNAVEQLMKRAEFFLEDGDWNSASAYLEKVLDAQPEFARAYVGKLMVECKARNRQDLGQQVNPFSHNDNFMRACRFADESLKKELEGYDKEVNSRIFDNLKQEALNANSEKDYEKIIQKSKIISWFEGVDDFVKECEENKDLCRKEIIYTSAKEIIEKGETLEDFEKANVMLEQIGEYKDAAEINKVCIEKIAVMNSTDFSCVICREREGTHSFVPNVPDEKCCDKCYNSLNVLYQQKGRESAIARTVLDFLNSKMPHIRKAVTRDQVNKIMNTYMESVPSLRGKLEKEVVVELREKTAYEIEEEKRKQEEERQKQEELRRQQIERRKLSVIEKNAAYEYEIQAIIDKSTGGTDTDMLKTVLVKNALSGWKLHSVISDKTSDGAPIGRSILIFERRIKEEE